jgi:Bor protein
MSSQALTLLLCLSVAGCATTTLRSGEPPGRTAVGLDEKWHAAFLFGAVRGVERYDLAKACPRGWAEVRVMPDPFTLLASVVTVFIYTPSRVTVVCSRQPGDETLSF